MLTNIFKYYIGLIITNNLTCQHGGNDSKQGNFMSCHQYYMLNVMGIWGKSCKKTLFSQNKTLGSCQKIVYGDC